MIRQCHLIKKPVLLIGGKNDKLVSPSVLCNFEGQFQSVNLQLIDDAGHLSVLENPEEYFVKIEQFV